MKSMCGYETYKNEKVNRQLQWLYEILAMMAIPAIFAISLPRLTPASWLRLPVPAPHRSPAVCGNDAPYVAPARALDAPAM